jgi:hypothetical protein
LCTTLVSLLLHLSEQLDGPSIAPGGKRGYPSDGIDGDRTQKLGKLARCSGVEAAVGTATSWTGWTSMRVRLK